MPGEIGLDLESVCRTLVFGLIEPWKFNNPDQRQSSGRCPRSKAWVSELFVIREVFQGPNETASSKRYPAFCFIVENKSKCFILVGYLQKKNEMPNQERLHIGHLIKTVFDKTGMTVAEFARRIHTARPNVYSIFERYDIGVEQLVIISFVLNHNFFDDIQQYCGLESNLAPSSLIVNINLDELKTEKANLINTILMELSEK